MNWVPHLSGFTVASTTWIRSALQPHDARKKIDNACCGERIQMQRIVASMTERSAATEVSYNEFSCESISASARLQRGVAQKVLHCLSLSLSFLFSSSQKTVNTTIHMKPEIVIAVIGNAQSGKSTLLESLVNELGGTYVSRELFPLEVETPAHNVTLYDIPDIASLWGTMQDGTIKPDAAVLCLSASSGEGVGGNDDETAVYLAATKELGIPQLAVAITKMDDTNWSQSRFNELVKETANLASRTKPARWNPRQLPFIPVSGLEGENLTNGTYNQPWFTGWSNVNPRGVPREGMTLLGAIDAFEPGQ